MSLDNKEYSRTVYNTLDLLGDVGGLLDALTHIGTAFVWLFQGNGLI